ncbi:SurA N-terminal domain-containing protein [Brucepastera parasyntrophica]|uniref:SurA N-terminal domain-containing protein n=1 Tax=Brucepastera parasyntrophica TaxID=2880008 RepID=UPI00210CD03F|nr:SurA N-terminal domain-containing protein [Brucepastera parasyntrophica]ULQ60476.1 SurA N-terminal domain-containing protein [Brucepastera parasyntrophica]
MAIKKTLIFAGAVLVLVLAVISFVFIPAFGGASSQKAITFGKWNGKPVEFVQDSFFVRQIQEMSNRWQNSGQELNQFAYYQIMQTSFRSAVIRLAILEEVEKAGYTVPKSQVDKNLVQYYLDENGKYSSRIFNATPEVTRSSRRAVMTEEMTALRYVEDVFGSENNMYGLKTSGKETDLLKMMYGPERSFNYVSFDVSAYPEAEIILYGQNNSELFEKFDLSIITVDSESEAKKIAAKIAKDEISFDDAVSLYSTNSSSDPSGKLGNSFRSNLNSLFVDAKNLDTVLNLGISEISPVIKTDMEYAIVRNNAERVLPDFESNEVISAVAEYMKSFERGLIEDYFVEKASGFVQNAVSYGFDRACQMDNLSKKTTSAFSINYGNNELLTQIPVSSNPELNAAVNNVSFFRTAFSLSSGEISEPVLLGNNVLVLHIAEEIAADTQILEMLPSSYRYYVSNWEEEVLTESIMTSKNLEDNFWDTYYTYFMNF